MIFSVIGTVGMVLTYPILSTFELIGTGGFFFRFFGGSTALSSQYELIVYPF